VSEPQATFICEGCETAVPWSQGCGDDRGNHCDACWAATHASARRSGGPYEILSSDTPRRTITVARSSS
jgi:hypothetical protein